MLVLEVVDDWLLPADTFHMMEVFAFHTSDFLL